MVTATAGALVATAPVWGSASVVADLARGNRRLPNLRALSFATVWSSLETFGVAAASLLWVAGRAPDADANYALQRWWAHRLLTATRVTAGMRLVVESDDVVPPGPVVLAARHSSIADTLIPVWLLARHDMRPRYVLKRELLVDPCLDIVGNRVPNHFVTRGGDTTDEELRAITSMTMTMGPRDGAVIYPEGTVADPDRRARALARLAETDPRRADQLAGLRRLLPPRHAGLRAALEGAPAADLVFVDHTGLEPLSAIASVASAIPLRNPVRIRLRRVPRRDIPAERDEFRRWLDEQWLELDRWAEPQDVASSHSLR
jgi:1-acyl-sn-glycerol-3-phosphate acyltransferase